jgi:hypothetical protein
VLRINSDAIVVRGVRGKSTDSDRKITHGIMDWKIGTYQI